MSPGKGEFAFISVFGRRSTQTDLELAVQGIGRLKREQRKSCLPLTGTTCRGHVSYASATPVAYLVCLKPWDSPCIFSTSQALMFPGQQTQF